MLYRAIRNALLVGCIFLSCSPCFSQTTSGISIVANADTNISRTNNDQFDVDVAIDRTNAQRVFFISDDNTAANGLFVGVSTDGGATFATRAVADGTDGLNIGNDMPVCTFDGFGNLFIAYRQFNAPNATIHVALSVNGGASFTNLQSFGPATDIERPAIAARNGDIWLAYRDNTNGGVVTRFAQSTGLNQLAGNFSAAEALQGSANGSFADVAIGPNGEAYVCYHSPQTGTSGTTIFVNVDADGRGGNGFANAVFVSSSNVGGQDNLPAQGSGTISSAPSIAVDLSNGPNAGHVYVVYTDETTDESNDTDIFIRSSANTGAAWSDAVQVNDAGSNSQFHGRIAVDSSTGAIVVAWYDARNDAGNNQGSDTNGTANDNVEFFASASIDGGLSFLTSVLASAGSSNAAASGNATGFGDRIAIDYFNGNAMAVRPDNSTQLGNNPDFPNLDIALAPLSVTVTTGPVSLATPAQVDSADEFTATLSLNRPAPAGGLEVTLTSTGGFVLPASVTVNQGALTATFPVITLVIGATADFIITATGNGVFVSRTITVNQVNFVTFNITPNTITGTSSLAGTIAIDIVVPTGGLAIPLTSDNAAVSVPASVTIPAGASSASFSGSALGVTKLANVIVTAGLLGQTRTQTLVLQVGDSNSGSSSGACFVATAAYGSPGEPQLSHLRSFRDKRLMVSEPGDCFTRTYYANSPVAAAQLKKSLLLRGVTRMLLKPTATIANPQEPEFAPEASE